MTVSHVGEFFSYYLSRYFLRPFLSPPPGTPIMLVHSMLSLRSLRLSFIFILFSLFFSRAVISTILSSSSLNHSLASFILLVAHIELRSPALQAYSYHMSH